MKKNCIFIYVFVFLIFEPLVAFSSQRGCFRSIPDIYTTVSPCVVFISSTTMDTFSVKEKSITTYGSGFVFREDGMILTSAHLVYKKSAIVVKLSDGKSFPAKLVGADPIMDIAVLKIQAALNNMAVVSFMPEDETIDIGEEAIVIGNPGGMKNTVSRGIVSGLNRVLPASPMSMMVPMIQTDAAISPGNSGCPMLNRCGEVIGMVTAVLSEEDKIGFALPIRIVKNALPQIMENGRVSRPWIGVHGKLISKAEWESIFKITIEDGFLVETVDPGSPAESLGIKGGLLPVSVAGEDFLFGGDIIVSANDLSFGNRENFERFVLSLKIGQPVRLTIFREGKTFDGEFVVSERPQLPWDLPRQTTGTCVP